MLRPGVYAIGNLMTGDLYIGSTIDLPRRKHQHWDALKHGEHFSSHLQRAWNKYGEQAFLFWVIENVPVEAQATKEAVQQAVEDREQYWIDSLQPTFNRRMIVDRHVGFSHSPETRRRMSLIASNRPPISEERRAKLRAAKLGKKLTPEHAKKIGDGNRGKKVSEETRARMSASAKQGKPLSTETRQKISQAKQGHTHSETTRLKMSQSASRRHARERQERLAQQAMQTLLSLDFPDSVDPIDTTQFDQLSLFDL